MRRQTCTNVAYCILISGLLLTGMPLTAKNRTASECKHYMLASLAGGYGLPTGDFSHIESANALAGQIQLGYEVSYRHFIMQTGVGVQVKNYWMKTENYQTSLDLTDTQGTNYTYTYYFRDRNDKAFTTSATLSLLFGARYYYFYFLSGLTGTFRFYNTGSASAHVSCVGLYNRYISDFSDMENHAFYRDMPIAETAMEPFVQGKVQISPYLEAGADFSNYTNAFTGYRNSRHNETRIRVAAYVQYGLINEQKEPHFQQPYRIDSTLPYNVEAVKISALLDNTYMAGKYLRQLELGIKVSVLFRVAGQNDFCVSCGY